MKLYNWKQSIRAKMICFVSMLLIIICVSMTFICVFVFERAFFYQSNEYLSDVVALAMANENNRIENVDQLSVSILTNKTVQKKLQEINAFEGKRTQESEFNHLKDDISAAVRASVLNTDGVVSLCIFSMYGDEITVGTTILEKFEIPLRNADIYHANGKNLWVMAGSADYVCVCRAILDLSSMQPIGHMVLICKNEYFSGTLQMFHQIYSSRVYLIDETGTVTASNHQEAVGKQFPYDTAEIKKERNRKRTDPFTDELSYYYVTPNLDNGWTMAAATGTRQYQSALNVSIICIFLILLLVLVLALIISARETKKLTEPTMQLLVSMSNFGKGNLNARVSLKTEDEIGRIGRAYNQMADKIQNLLETVYGMEIAKKESEIEFLKMQINPHFLYNTLDTISWLGMCSGNESVSDISVSLARLLRANVKNDSFITVEEEMRTVRDYMQIQHYRFGDKMVIKYDIDADACECYMPNFLLQPLIENSIVHGIENLDTFGEVFIQIRMEHGWIKFTVSDNGRGMTDEQKEHLMEQCRDLKSKNAIGLKNVYRRLQLLYGQSCQFILESTIDTGTRIFFRIPVKKDAGSDEDESEAELSME